MATLSDSIKVSRQLGGTSSTGLGNSLAIDLANQVQMKLRKMLIDKGIDACPVQESTKDLKDSQGTYLYPSDMFYVPKSIEINWYENPVTKGNFKPVNKVNDSNLPDGASVGYLRENQDANDPLIDYRGDYFELFPNPDASFWGGASSSGTSLTGALRIFYYLQPTLYTQTTDTLTYPENLDHFSFGKLIKNLYDYTLQTIDDAKLETAFNIEVGRLVHIIQGDGMSPTKARGISWSGWEF
jgi:hypothetical protein